MSGRLIGVGVGPGDPGLLTLNAVEAIRQAPVVAYLAAEGEPSLARAIASKHLSPLHRELAFAAPMRQDAEVVAGFYDRTSLELARVLDGGSDVALLCLGDPMLYGTFLYVLERLQGRFAWEVVPGITSASAAAAKTGTVLAKRAQGFAILPAMMPEERLKSALSGVDAAAVLKVGARVAKLKRALAEAGMLEGALLVAWVGWGEQERVTPLGEWEGEEAPYFSLVLASRREPRT